MDYDIDDFIKDYKEIYNNQSLDVKYIDVDKNSKSNFMNCLPYMKDFIAYIKREKLNVMIGGSTPIIATRKKNFVPNDIDCYILQIDNKKILEFDEIVKYVAAQHNMKITRVVSTLSLSYVLRDNDTKIYKIQLNIVYYTQWIKIFYSYHSGIVCSGYLILEDAFICYEKRFLYDSNFSFITNTGTTGTIKDAAYKYKLRGFNESLVINHRNNKLFDTSAMIMSEDTYSHFNDIVSNSIYKVLEGDKEHINISYDIDGIKLKSGNPDCFYIWCIECFFDDNFVFLDSSNICYRMKKFINFKIDFNVISNYIEQFNITNCNRSILFDFYCIDYFCNECNEKVMIKFPNCKYLSDTDHYIIIGDYHYMFKYKCPIVNKNLIFKSEFINIDRYNITIMKSSRNV